MVMWIKYQRDSFPPQSFDSLVIVQAAENFSYILFSVLFVFVSDSFFSLVLMKNLQATEP